MFEYTADNHFKFGYDKEWFADRKGNKNNWIIEYGQCKKTVKSWREECILAAQRIYDQRQGLSIDLLFSGGIDSEVVLRSFIESKVSFKVHFVKYGDHNIYDFEWVKKICDELNLKFIEHNLDIEKFWQSDDSLKIAEISKSISPQLISQQWLMSQVDGIPVLGSGECYVARCDIAKQKKIIPEDRILNKVNWVLIEREKIASWYRYAINTNRPAIPGFFQYTPELMLSFLQDNLMMKLTNNQIKGKLSNATSKFQIYKSYWPELLKRDKHSGFENILDKDMILRKRLQELYSNYHYEYWCETNALISYLKKEINEMPVNTSPNIKDPCDSVTSFMKYTLEESNKIK
jgi:hypothetical protein